MDYQKQADQFYASIGMERPKVSPGEKANITSLVLKIIPLLRAKGGGPYTLLMPDGEKLDDLGLDTEEMEQAGLDAITGWFADLLLIGDDLSSGIEERLAENDGKLLQRTVAGSVITVTSEGARVTVTDPWGVKAAVSDALFKGPCVTMHAVDNLIMWNRWKDALASA